MLTPTGRAQAIYNAIAATSANFVKLNAAEQQQIMQNLVAIFGTGDLAYLTANAQINPNTFTAPAGATTSPAAVGSPVTVVTPVQITGLGTLS
jgi:enolase